MDTWLSRKRQQELPLTAAVLLSALLVGARTTGGLRLPLWGLMNWRTFGGGDQDAKGSDAQ